MRAFFDNGGRRLYVKRIYRRIPPPDASGGQSGHKGDADTRDAGCSGAQMSLEPDAKTCIDIRARFPGAAGNAEVRITLQRSENVLGEQQETDPTTGKSVARLRVNGILPHDVVHITTLPATAEPGSHTQDQGVSDHVEEFAGCYTAQSKKAPDGSTSWDFVRTTRSESVSLDELKAERHEVRIVTCSLTHTPDALDAVPTVWPSLALDPLHERAGVLDSLFALFAQEPAARTDALTLPLVITPGEGVLNGLDVLDVLFAQDIANRPSSVSGQPDGKDLVNALEEESTVADRTLVVQLTGGNDGLRLTSDDYLGRRDPRDDTKYGLVAFEDIEDISIVAAPGSTRDYKANPADGLATLGALISHCERMRYRIAVLDAGEGQSLQQVQTLRAQLDSTHAALYYPWVRVMDPYTQRDTVLPPSGFVTGIYARNDIQRGVHKAPANEVITLAVGLEKTLNKGQQDVLNPAGINCLRYFPGRGYRVWGARTVSSDPEWKYVNLRRYFAYLEHSVDRSTQWAVFEPNGDMLWGNVRRTIEEFLFNEWQSGALLGDKAEKAFFVKCDRSTMTQNDLDNGRLICLIGVAPLRPAEFVIFRIGQWTADRRP
ncbi:phage tail sheath family protein [Streptomyces sp. NPDC059916]|uniref:phage tail sheath family protein n=1 Tax=Streptomyces sp. NPDC059916 TaxID=3347001 RepID=UPI00369BA371